MTGLIMILIYVVVATLSIRWIARYEGHYSIAFIFSIIAFAYGAGIPIELIMTGEEHVQVTSFFVLRGVSPDISWMIYILATLSVPFFCLGYILSGYSALKPEEHDIARYHNSIADNIPYAVLGIVLASLIIIFWRYSDVFVQAASSYILSSELQYTNAVAFLLYYLVYVGIAILAAIIGATQKGWGSLLAVPLWLAGIYLAIYTHERAPLALTALSMAYVLFHKTRGSGWLVAVSSIGAMVLLFAVTPIFSMLRSGHYQANEILPQLIEGYGLSLRNLDPAGPIYSIVMYLKDTPALQLGSTYISELSIFIPRFIWPDRPADLAEAFAREYMADWTPGMGFGYSPYAEAILNFGPYFAFIHFLIFGFMWGMFWRGTKFFFEINNPAERMNGNIRSIAFDALYRVAGFYLILMFFRGFFAAVFKELTMVLAPIFLFCVILYICKWFIPQKPTPIRGHLGSHT